MGGLIKYYYLHKALLSLIITQLHVIYIDKNWDESMFTIQDYILQKFK